MNILVTGANGQLGMEFRDISHLFPAYKFHFVSREQLSIGKYESVAAYFDRHQFDYCINCAAYTAVDKAESDVEDANNINGTAVGNLASVCKAHQTKLIHFSTDYVFNGNGKVPYSETDPVNPVNAYGRSKLLGEQMAISNHSDVMIIRTSWVYSIHGKNFVKTMMRLMQDKESINVVNDQVGSPTYAADLAQAVMKIIADNSFQPGIYHYCNSGIISWFQFANKIAILNQYACKVNPIATVDYPTPAKRPSYSALNTDKFQNTFNIPIPVWDISLQNCLKKISIT